MPQVVSNCKGSFDCVSVRFAIGNSAQDDSAGESDPREYARGLLSDLRDHHPLVTFWSRLDDPNLSLRVVN